MPPQIVQCSSQICQLQLSFRWPEWHVSGPQLTSHLSPMVDLPAAISSVSDYQGKLSYRFKEALMFLILILSLGTGWGFWVPTWEQVHLIRFQRVLSLCSRLLPAHFKRKY